MFASYGSNGEAIRIETPRGSSLFRRRKERKNVADRKILHAQATLLFRLFRQNARPPAGRPRRDSREFDSIERAQMFANAWGSQLVEVGPLGHIGSATKLGLWPQGLVWLGQFIASLPQQSH
jgi:hypothetical protein